MYRSGLGQKGRVDKFDNGRKGLRCAPHRCVSVVMEGSTPTSNLSSSRSSSSRCPGSADPLDSRPVGRQQFPMALSPPRIPAKIAKALIAPNRLISAPALIAPTLECNQWSSLHQDRVINQSIAFVGTRCSHFAVWLLRVRRIRQSYDTYPPSRHRLAASAHHPVVLSDAQTSVNTSARYRRTARPKKILSRLHR